MGVFQHFTPEPYTFLRLKQGAEGNVIEQEYPANGVFKLRGGMTAADNVESPTSDASLRVKPTEAFVADLSADLIGHGIRIGRGTDQPLGYRIVGQTEGYDYDLTNLDFYLLELKRESIAQWETSELPLE